MHRRTKVTEEEEEKEEPRRGQPMRERWGSASASSEARSRERESIFIRQVGSGAVGDSPSKGHGKHSGARKK